MAKLGKSVEFDTGFFKKTLGEYQQGLRRALARRLGMIMEDLAGIIRQDRLGPGEYDKQENWRFVRASRGQGEGSENRLKAAQAFAMAINITKKELGPGADFRRGTKTQVGTQFATKKGQRLKRKKKIFEVVGRGAGWERVLELFPSMAVIRPKEKGHTLQVLWIQSGQGRIGLDWGLKSIPALAISAGSNNPQVAVPFGSFTVGYIWVKHKYMEEHEDSGKYVFALPVVEQAVNSGRITAEFRAEANKFNVRFQAAVQGQGGAEE